MKYLLLFILPLSIYAETFFSYLHLTDKNEKILVLLDENSLTPHKLFIHQQNKKFKTIPLDQEMSPLRIRGFVNDTRGLVAISQFSNTRLEKPKIFLYQDNKWSKIGILDCLNINNYSVKNKKLAYSCADSDKEIIKISEIEIQSPDINIPFLSNKITTKDENWELTGGITYEWEQLIIRSINTKNIITLAPNDIK